MNACPSADCERLLAKAATVLAGVVDKVTAAEEAEEEAAQAPSPAPQQHQGWGAPLPGRRWGMPAAQPRQWGAPAQQQAAPAEPQQQGAAGQVAHLASVLDLSQVGRLGLLLLSSCCGLLLLSSAVGLLLLSDCCRTAAALNCTAELRNGALFSQPEADPPASWRAGLYAGGLPAGGAALRGHRHNAAGKQGTCLQPVALPMCQCNCHLPGN